MCVCVCVVHASEICEASSEASRVDPGTFRDSQGFGASCFLFM